MPRFPSCLPAFLLAVAGAGSLAAQQVVYVRAASSGANDGTSWADAFQSLQDALAVPGTNLELWVAAGTYRPSANLDPLASFALRTGVAVYGGFDGTETSRFQRDPHAHVTVLSGDLAQNDVVGSGRGWYASTFDYYDNSCQVVTASGVAASAVLDGFTIEGGSAFDTTSTPQRVSGAGLQIDNGSPTIVDCTFRHCMSYWYGGAVLVLGGAPSIRNCRFVENFVGDGWGGALYLASPTPIAVADCEFRSNSARSSIGGAGGALYVDYSQAAVVRGCTFVDNESRNGFGSARGPAFGGGIFGAGDGTLIERCRFFGNLANSGGGVCLFRPATVANCLFDGNAVVGYAGLGGKGGGLYAQASLGTIAVPVRDCTFVHGVASDNGGGAYLSGVTGQVNRCVFWNNRDTDGQVGRSQCRGGNPRYSCVQNLLIGIVGEDPPDPANYPGSQDLDPQFVDRDGANDVPGDEDDDLRLLPASPCIDAVPVAQTLGGVDLDGLPRKLDGDGNQQARLDMGAFEYGFGRLAVDVARTPALATVTIEVVGTPGGFVFLGIGAPGPETALAPLGAYFFDAAFGISSYSLGFLPATAVTAAPPVGAQVQLQAIVLGASGAATFTNAVTIQL